MEQRFARRSAQDGAHRTFHLVRGLLTLGIAAMLLVPAVAGAGEWGHNRDGWMLGLGIGGGSAGLEVDGLGSSDREGGGAGLFRVGYVIQPQFGIGLESSAWSKEVDGDRLTFSVTTAAASYYPGAGSFFLRGGVGVANGEFSTHSGSTTVKTSESGVGFLVGAGTEWRLARSFALGPEVTYSYGSFDGFNTNYFTGALQATWYFIPRTGD